MGRAPHVAGLELLRQRDLCPSDEADVAGGGRERGSHPDEERALLLREHERCDVGQHDGVVVDDREPDGRVRRAGDPDGCGVGGADRDDRVVAVGDELVEAARGGRIALAGGGGELPRVGPDEAEVGDGPLQARGRRAAVGTVAAAADVVGDADPGPGRVGPGQRRR